MLTLEKDDTSVPVVGIYHKDQRNPKKPMKMVHFTHNVDDDRQNVADAEGVLQLHKQYLKKRNLVNDDEFAEIGRMLDEEIEPDMSHPLRGPYWNIRDAYERFLKREMYLGDTPEHRFEFNFPRKRDEWPGSWTLIGNSGAGKTRHLVDALIRYLKSTPDHDKKPIIYLSPEVEIDKTLEPLKHKNWAMWWHPIDTSETALKKKGKDAATYYHTEVSQKLDTMGENSIVCWDDFPDSAPALVPMLEQKYNSSLRVARHRNQGVISLQHTYAGGRRTSQALQSNRYVTFFPRSQQARTIRFLTDHLQLSVPEAKALVRRFASLDRYMTVSMFSPVCIFNSKYLHLL